MEERLGKGVNGRGVPLSPSKIYHCYSTEKASVESLQCFLPPPGNIQNNTIFSIFRRG